MSRLMERRLRRRIRYLAEQARCADEYGTQLDGVEVIAKDEKLGPGVALARIRKVLELSEED